MPISFEQPEPFSGLGGFVAQYNADANRQLQLHQMGLSLQEKLAARNAQLAAGGQGGGGVQVVGGGGGHGGGQQAFEPMVMPHQERVDPLSQGEQLRLARLQQGISAIDEQVSNGTITAEEGNGLKVQIKTGYDPLKLRADRAKEQAQTDAFKAATDLHMHQSAAIATSERINAKIEAGDINDLKQTMTLADGRQVDMIYSPKKKEWVEVGTKGAGKGEKGFDRSKWLGDLAKVQAHAEKTSQPLADVAKEKGVGLTEDDERAIQEAHKPAKPRPFDPQTLKGASESAVKTWNAWDANAQAVQEAPGLDQTGKEHYLREVQTAKELLWRAGSTKAMKPEDAARYAKAEATLKNFRENWGPQKEPAAKTTYEDRWGTKAFKFMGKWYDYLPGT